MKHRFLGLVAFTVLAGSAWPFGHGGNLLRVGMAQVGESGRVVIREATSSPAMEQYLPTRPAAPGEEPPRPVKIKQTYVNEVITEIAARELEVFDSDGRKVAIADLPDLLREEVPVVLLARGQKPDPQVLRILKKGTLLIALPTGGGYIGHGGYGAPVPAPPPMAVPHHAPRDPGAAPPRNGAEGPSPQKAPPPKELLPQDKKT